MSDASGASGKICVFCGEDCAGQPRGKDPAGRYYHLSCRDEAKHKREEAPTPPPVADDQYGLMGDLLEEESSATAATAGWARRCAHCGAPLAPEAILCVSCGFNVESGEMMQSRTVAPKRASSGKSTWPVVIGVISIVVACVDTGIIVLNFVESSGRDSDPTSSVGQIVGVVVAALFIIWLLLAAARILRRQQSAVSLIRSWAITKIILMLLCNGIVIGLLLASQGIIDRLNEEAAYELDVSSYVAFMVGILIWHLAWPIFVLFWFGRSRVKEEVRTW